MATIAANVISQHSSDESVQQKVNKVRALHRLKDQREVEEVYDELAGNYDELVTSLEYCGPFFTSRTVSKIETKRDAKILDVACGTGLLGHELHKLGYTQIVGTDLSQSSLDVLAKKGSYIKSIHANFGPTTPLDFDDGGYIIITTRKYIFEGETGDMKLRPGLIKLTQEGALTKIAHEENLYEKDGDDHVIGITLVYQVI